MSRQIFLVLGLVKCSQLSKTTLALHPIRLDLESWSQVTMTWSWWTWWLWCPCVCNFNRVQFHTAVVTVVLTVCCWNNLIFLLLREAASAQLEEHLETLPNVGPVWHCMCQLEKRKLHNMKTRFENHLNASSTSKLFQSCRGSYTVKEPVCQRTCV